MICDCACFSLADVWLGPLVGGFGWYKVLNDWGSVKIASDVWANHGRPASIVHAHERRLNVVVQS